MPMTPFVRYIDYLLQTEGKNYEESGPQLADRLLFLS